MKKYHPLIDTLITLKGNPRACVYTEPLWGIPYNLFAPYASVYMLALGVNDRQIGLVATIGILFQIVFSLFGGIITDKLGRKRTTFIFDLISWSIPCIVWAIAKDFSYFVLAAVLNGIASVTMTSWGCLLVEDCDREQLVNIYSWVSISGMLAAFFTPLVGVFIGFYTLIPTVRAIYVFAFIMMTLKFVLLNIYSTETKQGKVRMEETKHNSIFQMLGQYGGVFKQILKTPETLLTLGIMLVMSIYNIINNSFWSIIVTEKIRIPVEYVGLFPFLRSVVMLFFFFAIIPRIRVNRFKNPMVLGFCLFILGQLLLVTAPEKGYISLILSIILEACSLSLIRPLVDSMQVIMIDPQERARIIAILYVIVLALSSPFGWIAGSLSQIDRILPFIMNMVLFGFGIALTYFAAIVSQKKAAAVTQDA